MPLNDMDQELLAGFLEETFDILEKLDDDLVTLEKKPDNDELLNRIFRSVHNVKGGASIVGFGLLVKVTHAAENVLNHLRKKELRLTSEVMDAIFEATNLIKILVNDIKNGQVVERDLDETLAKLAPFSVAAAHEIWEDVSLDSSEASSSNVSEDASEDALPLGSAGMSAVDPVVEQRVPGSTVASALVQPVAQPAAESVDRATSEPMSVVSVQPAPVASPHKTTSPKKPAPRKAPETKETLADNTTVRVDVKRLDDLMNQVGELVLERNRMAQLDQDRQQQNLNPADFKEEFGKLTKRMSFVTAELQMQVLKMRMMPVDNVFKKFPRIVRTLSRDLGKEVDLQIFGEETELDRSVVDEIGDPLIHLIRNALDHGLETPEVRVAAGKPRVGTLKLAAVHEGNQIIISIKDDGNGIDTERVGRKAVEKGLIGEEQLAAMGPREIFDLLFLPGFSTKDQANDYSGRGVGMDVVKTNIKKLNGLIEIKSELGVGSEFILRLPLTLAIIQSLLVEADGEVYSIPLSSVLETLRVEQSKFHMVGGQEVLKLRDQVLPLLRLQRVFSIPQSAEQQDTCYVVVIGAADKRLGLVVTRLVGQQEVAIKSLGNYLANIPGIAGSTILGDGRVALIADPVGLIDGRS